MKSLVRKLKIAMSKACEQHKNEEHVYLHDPNCLIQETAKPGANL